MTKNDKEAMLFFVIVECAVRQIAFLDNDKSRKKARGLINGLVVAGEVTMKKLYKNVNPEIQAVLQEYYDHIYMTIRAGAAVPQSEIEMFQEKIKALVGDTSEIRMFDVKEIPAQ